MAMMIDSGSEGLKAKSSAMPCIFMRKFKEFAWAGINRRVTEFEYLVI
jgi:hypothetical protein